jgi:hypothetical protein
MSLGSGIRNKPIPDHGAGSRDQKGTESRIRNTGTEPTTCETFVLHALQSKSE